ncbi:MAG: glycosyltransferase family 9 protein [Myxococcota bacterium]|nr:glycosyltransferase family 9 protein [Myxococcota bacterium]
MKRILLIRLTALGDVVLVEPVARALKQWYPGASVDLVTEVQSGAVLAYAKSFDRVITYDRNGSEAGWSGIGTVVAKLGQEPYDLVVDLQGKLRTRILARKVKSRRRLRLKKRGFWGGLLSLLGLEKPLKGTHAVDIYLRTFAVLGHEANKSMRPQLRLPPAQDKKSVLNIGLSAGTTHATKQWSAEKFAQLAHALESHNSNIKFTLFGGPKDRELLEDIKQRYDGASMNDADMTKLSVEEMTKWIASMDLFIGVDSGPTHLAAAHDIPVVAIFGPTAPSRWGPRGGNQEIVSLDLDCSPCSNTGGASCPSRTRDHDCMKNLSSDLVTRATLRVLEAEAK